MEINWKERLQYKQFGVSLIELLLVLANQTAGIFNVNITIYNAQITAFSETVLSILGLLGIILLPRLQKALQTANKH
ncbi:phage holin [Lysinibacillus sp. Y5S-8]|uniref:phage holin n=1 Tax=Lysinibacillus sp. Y5S-8 TaxID=3122488 RepID=UPI00116F14AF